MKPVWYLYIITNLLNGKKYVGQNKGDPWDRRWKSHLAASRKLAKDPNFWAVGIDRAIGLAGPENFSIDLLPITLPTMELATEYEDFLMGPDGFDTLNSTMGYNLTGAHNTPRGMSGKKHSAETRAKLSAKTGRKHTADFKAHIAILQTGHVVSPKTRAKISRNRTGKGVGWKQTSEVRERIRLKAFEREERKRKARQNG